MVRVFMMVRVLMMALVLADDHGQEEMDIEQMDRMIAKLKVPVFYEDPAVVPEDETEEHKYERKKRLARKVQHLPQLVPI